MIRGGLSEGRKIAPKIKQNNSSNHTLLKFRSRVCQRIVDFSRDLERAGFKPARGACLSTDGKKKEQQFTTPRVARV
jgi:hypothetical protein